MMTVTFDEAKTLSGRELGTSSWYAVSQDRINTFADATDDHQWIHVDPERAAAESPFGGPIAHGFLTLSLAVPMWTELLDVQGVSTKVNYGLDKVRFISPVKAGSRVRMAATIVEVTEVGGEGIQLVVDQTIEVEGSSKPAAVTRSLYRFYR